MVEEVRRRASEFDVLHFHLDFLHYLPASAFSDRMVTTLHGRLDLPDLKAFYAKFPHYPLVSISQAQRRPMPPVNWVGVVHHGLPADLLPFTAKTRGNYLAFLGRISPEKRPDRAIEIAHAAGVPVKLAAKVDDVDQRYWNEEIKPLVDASPNTEFVGEIDDAEKARFIGQARALIFPIDWPEPFGLVMIEAMACGTPVIAYRNGSVPEVIEDGVTGFVVDDIHEAVGAVHAAEKLDRRLVRACFEKRFTAERMALDYCAIYSELPGVSQRGLKAGAFSNNLPPTGSDAITIQSGN
jgi:glycosyltransferase involved in cell wall biosynthesis